jgi:transcription antitermination factor NusA-like protein
VTWDSARDLDATLPFTASAVPGRPHGAGTDEGVLIGDLLTEHVPEIASGELESVAIARRPGELSKVAVRNRLRVQARTPRPVPLVLGRAGERIRAVKRELPANERIDIVQWHAEPLRYVAASLGLSYLPSAHLYTVRRRADVLLGEIDYPSARGRRAINMLLTSALTGWQVRVTQIARSRNWHALERAQAELRSLRAEVLGTAPKGLRLQVYGLNALLPFGQISGVRRNTPPHVVASKVHHRLREQIEVTILRLDPDQGTVIVSERVPDGRQLRLPLT